MTTPTTIPLPRPGPLGLIQYAGVDMQEYAAAVSAEKDKEIAALRERVAALDDDREAMYKALVDLDELHTKAAEITLAAIRPQGVEGIDAARAKVCADCNEAADEIERLRAEVAGLREDAERYHEWKRAFREGECALWNALCECQSDAEHDAAIDAALAALEQKP